MTSITTVAEIFAQARLATGPRYTGSFVGLAVGGVIYHGQINLARATDYGRGPYVATIYILKTGGGAVAGFQHRASTPGEALAEVERLTQEWAQATHE